MDTSGRLGRRGFRRMKEFVRLLSRSFSISPSRARVAVVVYGSNPRLEFSLNRYTNLRSLDRAINRLRYMRGSRRTGRALQFALSRLFRRSRKKRVLVFLTSGQATDSVRVPSLQIHRARIETFAIGVGTRVRNRELSTIATDTRHIYMVTFKTLKNVIKSIVTKACKGIFQIMFTVNALLSPHGGLFIFRPSRGALREGQGLISNTLPLST